MKKNKLCYIKTIRNTVLVLILLLSVSIASFKFTSAKNIESDKFTVCLDAGHGDWDYGAIGISSSYEKDIVLAVTLMVGKELEANGINVVYTRTDDSLTWSDNSTENLYERVNISESNNSNLFLSIHCNSTAESSSYKGVETWVNPNSSSSDIFASYIQEELASIQYTSDRGLKYYTPDAPLAVLDHNSATSALVELGFISNLSDEDYLTSKSGQQAIANGIVQAILDYKATLSTDN